MAKLDFSFLNNFFAKLKQIKHIEVYAVVLLAVVVLGIWFMPSNSNKQENSGTQNAFTTTTQYAESLENRLNKVLKDIAGAGEVSCMVTLDGEVERVLAYSNDQKNSSTQNTTSSGTINKTETKNSSQEPIIITVNGSNEPLVIKEIMPAVKGVVVVATGADNVKVKLDILKAVQALLKIESSQIEIFCKSSN